MRDFIRIVRYAKPKFAPINKLSEFDRGWISGLVDGDGGLHFGRSKGKWDIYLYVSNTNLSMLEFLADMIGQGFIILKSEASETHKACYEYRVKAQNALADLLFVLKLHDKEGQRKLMLEALVRSYEISDLRMEEIEREVKQLNLRGPSV